MPTPIKYPGLNVEEIAADPHSIVGVSTSVAVLVGSATKGALNKPARVQNFAEFEKLFGALRSDLELGYAVRSFFLNGGTEAWTVRASRSLAPAKVIAAIKSLKRAGPFNLLATPGIADAETIEFAADYCNRRGAFVLVDPPATAKSVSAMQQFAAQLPNSRDAAVYFPRVVIRDPVNAQPRPTAPSGAIAGMMARGDAARGVWRAPAGSEATLSGVEALEADLADADINTLGDAAVNCLRTFPGRAPIAWSARTLASANRSDPDWKYIPIRRLFVFIERSIFEGTQWAVFEPNDESLWKRLRMSIETLLMGLWRQQAFVGAKSQEAFFVRCGRDETMTANDIASGALNIEVGFAPVRPAEFVILRIQHRMQTR